MAETQRRQVELLGEPVEYAVRRSGDATEPRIDVDIHGTTVVLPEGDDTRPSTLLKENAAWVVEKTRKYNSYLEQIPERTFEEGATFPYLGESHTVTIERRPSSSVVDGEFRLARYHVNETSIKRALEALYRRKAREVFESRADRYAAEMGVEYGQIEIRNQRTKWGSCSTTGTLGLNWRLMMASIEIVDYIVIHELAHLRESAHNDAFWSHVSEHDPEYVDHAEWLEEHGTQLIFSQDDV